MTGSHDFFRKINLIFFHFLQKSSLNFTFNRAQFLKLKKKKNLQVYSDFLLRDFLWLTLLHICASINADGCLYLNVDYLKFFLSNDINITA